MKRTEKNILLIISITVLTFLTIVMLSFVAVCGKKPPEPKIKMAEFNFILVYEIDGEEKVVEDTLICEFDGFGFNMGSGKWDYKWKSRYASGKSRITLWFGENVKSIFFSEKIVKYQEFFFYPGWEGYYMGDAAEETKIGLACRERNYDWEGSGGDFFYNIENRSDLKFNIYEEYGIKVINWEIDPPIVNTFK